MQTHGSQTEGRYEVANISIMVCLCVCVSLCVYHARLSTLQTVQSRFACFPKRKGVPTLLEHDSTTNNATQGPVPEPETAHTDQEVRKANFLLTAFGKHCHWGKLEGKGGGARTGHETWRA